MLQHVVEDWVHLARWGGTAVGVHWSLSMTKPNSRANTTHQQTIAKALHRACGCGYQEALRRVREAAAAGRLPGRLDAAGRAAAVAFLSETAGKGPTATGVRSKGVCPLPWPGATALAGLAPGTVTALVSLPTAGRSTLALNMALHAAEQGRAALFTSGEIRTAALRQKVITAQYGFDPRRQEPPGGWPAFKATALPEMEALPLYLHGAIVGSSPRDSLESGALSAVKRHQRPLDLWIVDTVQHFSDITDDGLDIATTMRQLRALAREYQLAVLVTAQVLTDYEQEPVRNAPLPHGIAEHAQRVLLLDRPGVYWTSSKNPAATLSLLTGTKHTPPVALQLESDRCRFTPA
ncbi:DnaB-like helicase C-terminal domain-containing protein [Streptomyces sp. NPDC000410]|uniref:DnaB-like helicase C-terminal domain-containing protein n=1 Tax=Streptomyces sp. NPDC000410 TaxID=3154254 RepID=UPI0033323A54